METNLLTSKFTLDFGEKNVLTDILAFVGVVSLLVFIIYPVSDP